MTAINYPRMLCCHTESALQHDVCGQLISPDGFLHHRRIFEYNVLILVTEGKLYITTNGIPYAVAAGQYIFLRAEEQHFGHQPSAGRLSYMWVHFAGDFTPGQLNTDCPYCFPEWGNIGRIETCSFLYRQLNELMTEARTLSKKMADATLCLMLMELTRAHRNAPAAEERQIPQAVTAVAEWITSNYYKSFTIAQLAGQFGYQADYLSSLFKKAMGISMVQYTNAIRIRSAKTLLMNYDVSIKEAAYSCGFSDEKYFMRLFKRSVGMTPTQYKRLFEKSGQRERFEK